MIFLARTFFILLFTILALAVSAQDKVPSSALKDLRGKAVNIQSVCEDDEIVVLSFWATWCAPCKNELDAINDIYDDMQEDVDFKLFAISIDDARTVKLVKPLVNGKDWAFDVLLDTNNDLKRKLGIASVPATFVIKNSEIVKRISGYKPGEEDDLHAFLKTL